MNRRLDASGECCANPVISNEGGRENARKADPHAVGCHHRRYTAVLDTLFAALTDWYDFALPEPLAAQFRGPTLHKLMVCAVDVTGALTRWDGEASLVHSLGEGLIMVYVLTQAEDWMTLMGELGAETYTPAERNLTGLSDGVFPTHAPLQLFNDALGFGQDDWRDAPLWYLPSLRATVFHQFAFRRNVHPFLWE